MAHLLIFGAGYSGRAIAQAASAAGLSVTATSREPSRRSWPLDLIDFADAGHAIARATHIVATAPPGETGDPVLARYQDELARAADLRWIGYLSTTGVYGDRAGALVDETTPPDPTSTRARRRIAAEAAWSSLATQDRAVDLIRLAGIYGPGRSVLDDVAHGRARPIRAPGHAFGRIHQTDIAEGTLAAINTADPAASPRVLNFTDDEPAESADVIAYAADLLGVARPVERTLDEAWPGMSPMARSFWSDNRRVGSEITRRALRRPWRYPTYREGLRAIMASQ